MRRYGNFLVIVVLLSIWGCRPAANNPPSIDSVTAGELIVEPPTLISLGFEWHIDGDANRNAAVKTSYRKRGEAIWRGGLPLLRVNGERTVFWDALDYTAPNMFAGSVFDLVPDTEYQCRFELSDPDGVAGKQEENVTVRTRAEPEPSAAGRVFHVYPAGYRGPKQEPSYLGLLAAYYTAGLGGDWSKASPPRVQPGDTILMHAGLYQDDRTDYSHEMFTNFQTCCGTTWDGTYYLTTSGTADRPIAIKAGGDGEVIFDGDGNSVLFNIMGADHLYFEGITFRNTDTAIDTFTNYSSSDYNGFFPNRGSDPAFQWNSPPWDQQRNYEAPLLVRRFQSLRQYAEVTGQDRHNRELDFGVFRNASAPDLSNPTRLARPDEVDLRLREGSAAVDAGVVLPNITDGYSGKAPDLGAYELGSDPPHYGPRPR